MDILFAYLAGGTTTAYLVLLARIFRTLPKDQGEQQ